ncbi:hypothetical protein [Methylobacterium iners]|uniref:Uncharacterized protein n=1 Tax=Methylobacterium iners TaxID=418707 RepID=A0ABQ4S2P7_9HYPH|nr:hypothetical protein [Methylobacterium iners]GJD97301.1 hypothetical protein OCOJLMKI_4530 [Methylobacterium iners]
MNGEWFREITNAPPGAMMGPGEARLSLALAHLLIVDGVPVEAIAAQHKLPEYALVCSLSSLADELHRVTRSKVEAFLNEEDDNGGFSMTEDEERLIHLLRRLSRLS